MVRILLVAIGLAVAGLVLGSVAIDEGEVVTLTTVDDEGREHDTQLWIVEVGGNLYLRSGSPRRGWLARLRDHPEVKLQRAGEARGFHAVPEDGPEVRRTVNRAMAEKYGMTDRFYSRLIDRSRSVPVLLMPSQIPGAKGSGPGVARGDTTDDDGGG